MLFAITIALNEISFSTLLGFMPIFLDRVHAKIENDAQLYYTLIIQQSASLPGISLSSYLIETRLGRKWTVSLSFLFMGLSIFLFYSAVNYPMLLVFSSIQTCFNYIGYSAWYAMVSEFYPTGIRSGTLGWLSFCDKFFGLIAVSIIGALLGLPGGLEISIFICSFSCICSGIISMFLPETKTINLL
ncbi:unnamed protein product [Blepharisma stoltei]|uniref:Major facilitator superfamily (MFS) profile domain-containing protein n=1 Tax=Blepharisma stoltei TaxID=1481888 RepID=A0AAU9IXK5_9CILI|nr:unnamed protein product [Blepharisma stoltei]